MWLTTITLALRALLAGLWFILKPVLGWFFIVIGLIGMPMPIVNGLIFLMLGLLLVGPRNRIVRWWRVRIKLVLRWWAALPHPLLGWAGRLADRSARQVSRSTRRLHWWWAERRAARRLSAGDRNPSPGD